MTLCAWVFRKTAVAIPLTRGDWLAWSSIGKCFASGERTTAHPTSRLRRCLTNVLVLIRLRLLAEELAGRVAGRKIAGSARAGPKSDDPAAFAPAMQGGLT